jgi:hypothetical protein
MKRRPQFYLQWLATFLVATMALLQPWFAWLDPSLPYFGRIWWYDLVQEFTRGWHSVDDMFLAAPREIDLGAVFVDFDARNPKHYSYAQEVTYRAQYTIYPRRLYFAEPGTKISNGGDIIQAHFDPPGSWFQQHHVWNVIYFTMRDGTTPVATRAIVPPPDSAVPVEQGQLRIMPWNPLQTSPAPSEGSGR